MDRRLKWLLPLCFLALIVFFILLYLGDNKYQAPPPYGYNGLMELCEADLYQNKPLVLANGWLLNDMRTQHLATYIGEYSNLSRGDNGAAPHGGAEYTLKLRYTGEPVAVVLYFPQLFHNHTISLDDDVLSRGRGGTKLSFTLDEGDHLLRVKTFSRQGYYSGMYHPPLLGTTKIMFQTVLVQCITYGLAFFMPLTLAAFTLSLWRSDKDKAAHCFGLLCCFFALYVSHYFVRLLEMPLTEEWYFFQSAALYGLALCVLHLTALLGGLAEKLYVRWLERILRLTAIVLLVLSMLIPALPMALVLHSIVTDLFYIAVFSCLLFLLLRSQGVHGNEQLFSLLGCIAFGTGLLCNLLFSKLFEPIYGLWQFEWCGLLLVIFFGAMMSARNKRMLAENDTFRNGLEILVEERTEELHKLLQERKAFFADMAHDLKAPIFATKTFIQAIRENNAGVDSELLRYVDLVEQKQQEMARRVQSLTTFNRVESISEPQEPVSILGLLSETYAAHHMAAEVASVFLDILPPEQDGFILAQRRKLDILLENLIYNALRATPSGGHITLAAELDEMGCHLSVSDTGCGIPIQELPHIFERFFIGQNNQGSGSGLGLYISKSIVDELQGELSVSSKPGQGATFFIDLPLMDN